MFRRRWVLSIVLAESLGLFCVDAAWAQLAPERLAAVREVITRGVTLSQRLPLPARHVRSGGARNLINLAERWDQIEPQLRRFPPKGLGLAQGAPTPHILAPGPVSNPSTDVIFSSFSGFTQNETSTARCGSNVVVGFNDSGSFLASFFASLSLGTGGLSFNGVARSTNVGCSYTDLGFLNPGPTVTDFLVGDPVVACGNASTFYYASIFSRATTSDISVSKSTDGGATWGDPVSAASKSSSTHLLEKAWMAVDPTNTSRLYVTYTDFDFSGTSAACGPDSRTAIELVRSTNGGATWSAPLVIKEVCGAAGVQGSQVVVGPGDEVYVAWETFAANFVTRELDATRSTDNGASVGSVVKVDDVTCVGSCGGLGPGDPGLLQGAFRVQELPSLAVDRSGLATNGNLYMAWNDARDLTVPDALSGTYGYADILVSRSTNGGASWSTPVRVNNNVEPLPSGLGTDQYQPGIAVDRSGKVEVCFYDRRRDPNNFLIDRFCARSTTAGATWSNTRVTSRNFAAVSGQDLLLDVVYMGDYDTVAADFTQLNAGFITSWGDNSAGNPDVQASKQ